ncbi:MAG: hypothetical protein NZ953_04060 [Thaumarchaeota archaeon]|nr:hypothetical protein [Candidatus Calditenuaceae archaeon]MCX8202916.1 hypothetical protein [Nitrososphaeria archaeon]MDW8043595.1 hypothetical protein [Nitrososphaerota archaeon]
MEFEHEYFTGLKGKEDLLECIREMERRHGVVILPFAARGVHRDAAVALLEYPSRGRSHP